MFPIRIHVDNQSAMSLANNPTFHARTKHIAIQYHFVREKVNDGMIELEFCPSEIMIADIMTKPLGPQKHTSMINMMGLTKGTQ